jgi:PTS system nitrogen regulatory IIA component
LQLRVRDVSKFLNVSESTVMRWIKQRGLPARQVVGQYRFNRAELLEWATANHIKVSLELFDHFETEEEPVPSLTDALEAGGIVYQMQGSDKHGTLRALVQALPLPDDVDRELLLRLFLAREASATTAIGDGIALPHVRNPIVLPVSRSMATLCFLEQSVDFGALDGKPVRVLFSLTCPTTRAHLQLMARLSFALHDEQFKEVLQQQGSRERILTEVRRIETGLDVSVDENKQGAS